MANFNKNYPQTYLVKPPVYPEGSRSEIRAQTQRQQSKVGLDLGRLRLVDSSSGPPTLPSCDISKEKELRNYKKRQSHQYSHSSQLPLENSSKNPFSPKTYIGSTNYNHYKTDSKPVSGYNRNNIQGNNNNKNVNKYGIKTIEKVKHRFKSGEEFELFHFFSATKIIGEGSYACVCEVIDTRNNKKYAIKKNRNCFVNIGDSKRILRELKLMKHFIGHPNLMAVVDVIPPDIGTQQHFENVFLIMPKMHFTLTKLIRRTRDFAMKICEADLQQIIYQICRGLEYMHNGGIIHRDIKPENILINCYQHTCKSKKCTIQEKKLWQVKITDFGLSRGINSCKSKNKKLQWNDVLLTEYVVTRYYRAPEVMCCSRLYDTQIDVWSLGCIFGEIYHKKPLFKGQNHLNQLQCIFESLGTPSDLSWVRMNDAKQWLLRLATQPKRDMKKLFSYNWNDKMRKNHEQKNDTTDVTTNGDDYAVMMSDMACDFLKGLLTINPHRRLNIENALKHQWLSGVYNHADSYFCPEFDTDFENEPILKTEFGVRHMMYEELMSIHKQCRHNLSLK